ncbi:MAG TPA: PfkB family carbohydrate kinase [Saprospiraceae bacterium]|nr:PfkB family carbohydrate kinase [Saprospiraceae bacterium]HMQ82666.1 PfkB family carbohydrate kinase [Saprospiraceae bacterium]
MNRRQERNIAIISVGELLIDFISSDFVENLSEAKYFTKFMGGSPANLVMNMVRLGNNGYLAATLGNDDMGDFLTDFITTYGVNGSLLRRVGRPTTLILVTRSKEVSNFEAYRGADAEISEDQFDGIDWQEVSLFHTTCFALSLEPAQSTILNIAHQAFTAGCQLSIDANYAQKIWPDRAKAQAIVQEYCQKGSLVKVSEVDWERLYGHPLKEPNEAADHFLELGARAVCVTLGGDGCLVADRAERHRLGTRPVDVKDTTGAGDAFWSGFLTAWLDGYDLLGCAKAGRAMAEIKLACLGPLPPKVERRRIYEG